MITLNLPEFQPNLKIIGGKQYIFDIARKKFVLLTPEEWVRQSIVHYLISHKGFPEGLFVTEGHFRMNKLSHRYDVMVYGRDGNPMVLIECKATSVELNRHVFDQVSRYAMRYKTKYLIITNGMKHYCCHWDEAGNTYRFIKEIPIFNDL